VHEKHKKGQREGEEGEGRPRGTPCGVVKGPSFLLGYGREGKGRRRREEGRGKREEGRGKREEGRGTREERRGKREVGKREEGRSRGPRAKLGKQLTSHRSQTGIQKPKPPSSSLTTTMPSPLKPP
jgi:hypothetical protein